MKGDERFSESSSFEQSTGNGKVNLLYREELEWGTLRGYAKEKK